MRMCDSGGCIYCPYAIIIDGVVVDCKFAQKEQLKFTKNSVILFIESEERTCIFIYSR